MSAIKRSVNSSTFSFAGVDIPIKIYKARDDFGFSTSYYHEGCGGKIREARYCELHPGDSNPQVYSAIAVGTDLIRVDNEIKDELLGRNSPLEVISSHRLSEIPSLMMENSLIPIGMYQVEATELPVPTNKEALCVLLERLRVKKRFLLCTVGLLGSKRYAILLPGGQLLPLTFRQEVRSFDGLSGYSNRELARSIDEEIDSISGDFPDLSCENLDLNFTNWLIDQMTPKKAPRRNRKKTQTKTTVPVQ